ncbi:hypothetical protein ACFFK0_22090 [Paenibacillus chartarius]|uniref:Uncharacterized protein n=1 Tax=Paenibacillus chartarius TaxID=747481 RepID=A0ABV6DR12_9BACL
MPNYVPYLVLCLIHIPMLITVAVRKRQYSVIVVSLGFSGIVYVVEYVILVLLGSYSYYPGLLPDRFQDSVLGAVVSNLIAIPVTATVIAVNQLSNKWIMGAVLLFACTEWLFVKLGVYELHWWRIPYTSICLVVFFSFGRLWYKGLMRRNRWCRFVTLHMQTWSMVATIMFLFNISGIRLFHLGLVEEVHRDDIMLASIFGFAVSLLIAAAILFTKHILWKLGALLLIVALNAIMAHFGYLDIKISNWLYYAIYIPSMALCMWLCEVAQRSLQRIARAGSSVPQ